MAENYCFVHRNLYLAQLFVQTLIAKISRLMVWSSMRHVGAGARGMMAWGMWYGGLGVWGSGIGEMRFQPQNSSTHNFGFRLAVVMFLYAGNKITINASRGLLSATEGSGVAGGGGINGGWYGGRGVRRGTAAVK